MAIMQANPKYIAYIDAANLHKGVKAHGWKLDYKKFRIWLAEKHQVGQVYLFIGLISKYKDLYTKLQEAGYTLVFKETTYDGDGNPKGNCDADLVLKSTTDAFEGNLDSAVIVSSDGDYASLIKFLMGKNKLKAVVSPANKDKCSILIKRTQAPITYINDIRKKIEA